MGWWFGRILTFEVIADANPPSLSSIMTDASAGFVACNASDTVVGYAAYGKSIASAIQPLVDCFDVPLFDDGLRLRTSEDLTPVVLDPDELGSSADGERVSRLQREQLPVRLVPSALRLTYYDPAREYQSGEARAIAGEQGINEAQQDLPAVLAANDAKGLVHQMLARQWSGRDRLTVRLPPARVGLVPGTIVACAIAPGSWIVEKCSVEGFVSIAELRPSWQPTVSLAAESGRMVGNTDEVESAVTVALIDAPSIPAAQVAGPTVLIAASSPNRRWAAGRVTVGGSSQGFVTQRPVRKSFLGNALNVLADAQPYLIDELGSVDVQLVDDQQWLTSCDDDALAEGINLAVLGSELVQFGQATPLGGGRFRLAHLLRGRGGTEWATAGHCIGELFCLLDGNSVRPLSLPAWMRGSAITATDQTGSSASLTVVAESVRPLAPANLSASLNSDGSLILSWTRRSRSGFAWLDEVDAPYGETREEYRINITADTASLELTSDKPAALVAASELAQLGTGAATVEVRQIGDYAASRPAQVTINLQ